MKKVLLCIVSFIMGMAAEYIIVDRYVAEHMKKTEGAKQCQ